MSLMLNIFIMWMECCFMQKPSKIILMMLK